MGRHLEFDKQDVLGNAMQVFWRKGYAETSMQDLADACGINKASIYNTWTNKEQFFSAVIDFYCDSITRQNAEELRGQDSGRAAIEAYFDGQIAFLCNEGHGLGCFLTNTAGELGFTSPPIIERLRKIFFEMMENFMGRPPRSGGRLDRPRRGSADAGAHPAERPAGHPHAGPRRRSARARAAPHHAPVDALPRHQGLIPRHNRPIRTG